MSDDLMVTEIYAGGQVYATWSDFDIVVSLMNPGLNIHEAAAGTPASVDAALVKITTIFGTQAAINPNAIAGITHVRFTEDRVPPEFCDQIQYPEGVER